MPTLEELRRQFRAGPSELRKTTPEEQPRARPRAEEIDDTDEEPRQQVLPGLNTAPKVVTTGRFSIIDDGADAILHFGKFRERRLSEIAQIESDYLSYIMREDFPKRLKDAVMAVRSRALSSGGGGLRHISKSITDVLAQLEAKVAREAFDVPEPMRVRRAR